MCQQQWNRKNVATSITSLDISDAMIYYSSITLMSTSPINQPTNVMVDGILISKIDVQWVSTYQQGCS